MTKHMAGAFLCLAMPGICAVCLNSCCHLCQHPQNMPLLLLCYDEV